MIARTIDELLAHANGTLVAPAPATSPVVTQVVTDSRQAGPGTLFVAIQGERVDGHDFLGQVAAAGASAAIIKDLDAARASLASAELDSQAIALIQVPDPVEALGELARRHLADLRERAQARGQQLTVVGMTGSVGKTTTKDLTRQLLAACGPTVAPRLSFNNEVGLPLTVLETDESTRYLVLEMGASGTGHISYLTQIAPLDAAAVLLIGHAHMGGFGSVDGVAAAKSEIVTGLLPTGTAVLNLDDPRSAAMESLAPGEVLRFSASGHPNAQVRATEVKLDPKAHAVFKLHLPGLDAPTTVRLCLPGAHNVSNALAAASLALAAGASAETVADALEQARMESPHRLDVSDLSRDILLIDDSYNANIDSMTASLASLPAIARERRRVVVISEMLELGESSGRDHARTGELAVQAGAALVVAIGEGTAPLTAAVKATDPQVQTVTFPDAEAAIGQIISLLHDGDAVLIKGSNGSGAWRLADHLKEVLSA
ncbi:UDP-N-acetylmuramoyl-tripeptide--D-alanyl-D-alanine ligase [Actinomyces bovis]|uniref:UDP-N-acetylmuramoyl-tripeptide--D-alanyl-D-alanine ligase n=1 Tax=Actinomyces bovis TaxID=1658 RepID=A0ABY1VP80_9ACTO|nr:UDP-N-acetylmuramoyl-tripeptide--D-alanyl-D-alanine ligase [Actinomyces bovis]SPT53928.1 UDP-N-acetylmuramoyl-tripeptide--D-alanyl-D-alanine ligase [Actinomyces bovis]VEG53421.1 UDP-N-acetylmuramoyl-tripeptide--D-alanyl-D-alanine ligase [Actinomyces israelii]